MHVIREHRAGEAADVDFFQQFGESARDGPGLQATEQYGGTLQMFLRFQSRASVVLHPAARFRPVFDEASGEKLSRPFISGAGIAPSNVSTP